MGAPLHLEPACESGSGQTVAESLEELHFLERHWVPVPMGEITNFGSGFAIGGGGGFAGGGCGENHGHAVRVRGKLGSHFGGWVCVNPSTTPATPTTSSTSSTVLTPVLSPSSSTSTIFEVRLDGGTATVLSATQLLSSPRLVEYGLEKESEIEERGQEQALVQGQRTSHAHVAEMSSSSSFEPLLYSREPAGVVDKDGLHYKHHVHPPHHHHHRAQQEKDDEHVHQEIPDSTSSKPPQEANKVGDSEQQNAQMHRNGFNTSQYPPRPTYPPAPTYPRPTNSRNATNYTQLPPDLRDPAASHHFAASDSDDSDVVGLSIRRRKVDWHTGTGPGQHGQGPAPRQAKRMPILPLLPLAPSPPHTAVPHPQTAIHVPPTARAAESHALGGPSHLASCYTASSSSSNASSPTSPFPPSTSSESGSTSESASISNPTLEPLLWSHPLEHADRARERAFDAEQQAGGAQIPGHGAFEVDRKVLKDVVREKMGEEVGRIRFLSGGTFHKAYLVTLSTHQTLVARVARRFMPRLKTASEVATIAYLDKRTPVPVPTIYDYDANPYNRLGGEWVLMSKAPGIPLAEVWHGLAYADIVKLLKDLAARVVIPLFAHRFDAIGSLYFGPDPTKPALSNTASNANGNANASATSMSRVNSSSSGVPTPRATAGLGDPFAALGMTSMTAGSSAGMSSFAQAASALTPTPSSVCVPELARPHPQDHEQEYHIGPIISWPFFGSNRGELAHPSEINRGPFPSLSTYLSACLEREHSSVIRENEGKAAPHRLHLDPDEVHSSFHHRLLAVPGDESDDSDEWGLEESDDEWEGPGDKMYRDYRRMQRGTFLVRELKEREDRVRAEMGRWIRLMEGLTGIVGGAGAGGERKEGAKEEFGLDCHDLSLENVFVDERDHTKITCIIDWESTTTRPLWQCAHVPAFLQSSPFVAKLFREIVAQLPNDSSVSVQLPPSYSSSSSSGSSTAKDLTSLCREWLYYEAAGTRLRMAHRCSEWDGWEEGLVDSILGAEEDEAEWYTGLDKLVEEYRAGCSGTILTGKSILGNSSSRHPVEQHSAEHSPLHGLFESGPASPLPSNPEGRVNGRVLSPPSPSSPGPTNARWPSSSKPLPPSSYPVSKSKTNGNGNAIPNGKSSSVSTLLPPSKSSALPPPPSSARLPNTSLATAAARPPVPKLSTKLPLRVEQEKEQMLNTTGDICGGRGGELGRRLEAWIEVSGSKDRVEK